MAHWKFSRGLWGRKQAWNGKYYALIFVTRISQFWNRRILTFHFWSIVPVLKLCVLSGDHGWKKLWWRLANLSTPWETFLHFRFRMKWIYGYHNEKVPNSKIGALPLSQIIQNREKNLVSAANIYGVAGKA